MKNLTTYSRSESESIPLSDGEYRGAWTSNQVVLPMDYYEIHFSTIKSIGSRKSKVNVLISGGVGYVEVMK